MAKKRRKHSKQADSAQAHSTDKKKDPNVPPPDVVLKPIFGIHPGYYVTGILAALVLVLLFLLLAYPGLRSDTRRVSIDTTPPRASVYHDGVRLGSTPGTFDLPLGETEITLRRPGFHEHSASVNVPTRWFATLLLPPRVEIRTTLDPKTDATETILANTAEELTRWAAIGESTQTRPLPPLLSAAARDGAVAAAQSPETKREVQEFLLSSTQNVTSSALLRDLIHAAWITTSTAPTPGVNEGEEEGILEQDSSANPAPGALAAGELVNKIIHLKRVSEGFLSWIDSVGAEAISTALRETNLLDDELRDNRALEDTYGSSLVESVERLQDEAERRPPLHAADMEFVHVPGGNVLLGYSEGLGDDDSPMVRLARNVEAFYMARVPVTVELWRQFLAEHPRWNADRRSELMDAGLVDQGYLRPIDAQADDEPVTGVSWHAARAFAEWVDERAGENVHISLPSEAQWARAAALDSYNVDLSNRAFGYATGARGVGNAADRSGHLNLIDLVGNVWEWTRTPYYAADTKLRLTATELVREDYSGYAVVRGGSWANDAESVGYESRGGQPKNWSTPFLGFRLIATRGGE